eukprot:TRINITY_DN66868_c3_g1_i5.p1 TRINITY_DN66868_c3_g1~~TRINITY_DN66868_c3_g1_i5.p1  ORF type:complete len:334 (-),score=28.99 TRINITY_DN66868_c3_g1_i5:254-1255(-)
MDDSALGGLLTRDEFSDLITNHVLDALKSRGFTEVDTEFDKQKFILGFTPKQGSSVTVSLGDFHYMYNSDGVTKDARRALMKRISETVETDICLQKFEDAKKYLYPILRPLDWKTPKATVVSRPWERTTLKICYVAEIVKRKHLIVTEKELVKWKKTEEDLYSVTMENLKELHETTLGGNKLSLAKSDGVYEWQFKSDRYSASRLLIPEVFSTLRVDGDAVILLINDNSVFITGVNRPPAVNKLKYLAQLKITEQHDDPETSIRTLLVYQKDAKTTKWRLFADKDKHICGVCEKYGELKCSRCQKAFYCSADCQKADWKLHKKTCQAPPLPSS